MNTAVRQAIQTRLNYLELEIQQDTEVLTSYESQLIQIQTVIDSKAAHLDQLEAERAELVAALPEAEEGA